MYCRFRTCGLDRDAALKESKVSDGEGISLTSRPDGQDHAQYSNGAVAVMRDLVARGIISGQAEQVKLSCSVTGFPGTAPRANALPSVQNEHDFLARAICVTELKVCGGSLFESQLLGNAESDQQTGSLLVGFEVR